MSTIYSIGQMNQLADALEAARYTLDDVTRLRSKPEILKQLKPVLMGTAEAIIKTHIIDCDKKPFVPDGCEIEEHIKGGEFVWNPDEVSLYLCDEQKSDEVEGDELRKKLEGKPVLNANVLDYLLENTQLIPEEWKGRRVVFWGTIYRRYARRLLVRFLYGDDGRWGWTYCWLVNGLGDNYPAALQLVA